MKKIFFLVAITAIVAACQPRKKGYILPDPHDVIMYEVNPLVFAQEGAFNVIANRLDSIRALNVNVMWFMPIYEQGVEKANNSPYLRYVSLVFTLFHFDIPSFFNCFVLIL